jgi:cytochrome P450
MCDEAPLQVEKPMSTGDLRHRAATFPLGDAVTIAGLDGDPHPIHHALRGAEPVSWLPALDGWLITRHDLALAAMRDAQAFTVDDPRFSTGQVIGPSMLSLDGEAHARHRAPFTGPFRAAAVAGRFAQAAADEARELVGRLRPAGAAELRRAFAGPMSAAIVARALGITDPAAVDAVLAMYDAIVASVTSISAGTGPTAAGRDAYGALRARLEPVIAAADGGSLLADAAHDAEHPDGAGAGRSLSHDQIASNAAVLLFGGIETTEGMIASAVLDLVRRPELLEAVREEAGGSDVLLDGVIDESLRLEPAAAAIDRYATADTELGGAAIRRGELVRISITGANRDPAVFPDPDTFEPARTNARRHLAFAQGPHVCVGVHLARLETRAALRALISGLPDLRLDPARPSQVRGLVFRKPVSVHAHWTV